MTKPPESSMGAENSKLMSLAEPAVTCTALSAGLLLAPSAHHRLLWRRQAREHRLRLANRLAIAGMMLLVVAMVGVMFVITDLLFGSVAAAVATAAVSGFFLYVWFLMPIRYRLNGK